MCSSVFGGIFIFTRNIESYLELYFLVQEVALATI